MANQVKINPAQQVDQAKKFLLTFYEKPVAQVSTELFFTIAATIFFALFAIRPTILTMTELVKEIEDKENALDALNKKVAALSSVQNEYFSLQNQFFLLDEAVPDKITFKTILQTIEKTASDMKITISTLQIKEVPFASLEEVVFTKKNPTVIDLTVNVSGSYTEVRDFIDRLSNLRPLFTIDSVSVSTAGTDQTESDFLNATIRIQAHYYSDQKPKKDDEKEDAPADEEKLL